MSMIQYVLAVGKGSNSARENCLTLQLQQHNFIKTTLFNYLDCYFLVYKNYSQVLHQGLSVTESLTLSHTNGCLLPCKALPSPVGAIFGSVSNLTKDTIIISDEVGFELSVLRLLDNH